MISTWLTLRQAQDALNKGRLDDALQLANRPEVRRHKKAGDILEQIGGALVTRARLQLQHQNDSAAWKDLLHAEEAGVQNRDALKLRQELIERGVNEVQGALDAGEPHRAVELLQKLNERSVQSPELKSLEDIARSWGLALDLVARGEFSQAVSVVDRVGASARRFRQFDAMRTELGRKQRDFDQILMKLHRALEAASWREVIQHADQILAIAPEHAEARKARARAWRAVEPPTVTPAKPEKDEVKVAVAEEPSRRFLLWIDGVGGYLVCLSYRVSFGQATPESYVDIPLLADVSRLHGYLTRDAEGYLLESVRPVSVNDKITDRALLQDGDRLTIGGSCRLQFQKPVELSATARLDVISSHRLPLAVDGVILMADNLILGSGEGAHVLVPDLRRPVVLYRKKECLAVRAAGDMTVDGHKARDKANLGPASTVTGDDFRFTLEPIGAHMGINKMRA